MISPFPNGWIKKAIASLILIGGAGSLHAQNFHLVGYASAGAAYVSGEYAVNPLPQRGRGGGGIPDTASGVTAALYSYNVAVSGLMAQRLYGYLEVHSQSGVLGGVEQAWVGLPVAKNLRVVAGKFILPFGAYSQYYHAPWIHKLERAPLGLAKLSHIPLSHVGVQLTGVFPLNAWRINYNLYMTEGWKVNPSADFLSWRIAQFAPGSAKLWGARVGMWVPIGLEVRLSAMHMPDLTAQAVDVNFRKKAFQLRGEYARYAVYQKPREGYYVEAAYFTKAGIEPVAMIGGYTVDYSDGSGTESGIEAAVGANYYLSPATMVRLTFKRARITKSNGVQEGTYGALSIVSRF